MLAVFSRCLEHPGLPREDIATNALPDPEQCTPWEELREAHLTCLAAQRPAVA